MIETRIRKHGDDFEVTIPAEAMEQYGLAEGDTIVFTPSKIAWVNGEKRYLLSPEHQAIADRVLEEHRDALLYLADKD